MSEQVNEPKILLTDTKVLHKIKFMQFRRQMIPLGIVVLLLIANIIYPFKYFFYPTLAAFAWYLLERIFFRTKNKIAAPETGTFVSPVNGKIQSVRKITDSTLITIRKSWLDIVELRLPFPDLKMENNREWYFLTAMGRIGLRIESNNITFFENKNITGDVIGVILSSAIFTINVPASVNVLVKEGQPVAGGETVLFAVTGISSVATEVKSILVEEPFEDLS